ncbi:MAG: regulatory protein GemA [Bacteroides sp.]|nr:regulatory protein GemA [Eubacterium sp.]MCM1419416.1 regulatory protein GemA [Roseburia sp.]MCM1462997.1 regulatory protein GemA [Bacteroides sp.]
MAATEWTRKIYGLGAACGIVESGNREDGLHSVVYRVSGKTSVRELTEVEARKVITELYSYLRIAKSEPPPTAKAKMTGEQAGLAFRLVYRLAELDTTPSKSPPRERLCGVIRKVVGIEVDPGEDIFKGFSEEQGSAVIEELKRYVRTAERREKRKSGKGKD